MPRVGDAREDWTIIRALSEIMGKPLPYDDKNAVRARLAGVAPHFAASDTVQVPMWLNGEYFKVRASCRHCPGVLQEFHSVFQGDRAQNLLAIRLGAPEEDVLRHLLCATREFWRIQVRMVLTAFTLSCQFRYIDAVWVWAQYLFSSRINALWCAMCRLSRTGRAR